MDFILGAICALCIVALIGTFKIKIVNRFRNIEKDIADLNELASEIAGGEF